MARADKMLDQKRAVSLSVDETSRGRATFHYALIYLMLLIPGSTLLYMYGGNALYGVIVAATLLTILFCRRCAASYGIVFVLLLLGSTLLVRWLVGGVGLSAWLELSACVLIVQAAITFDSAKFLDRWVRTVLVFAVASVVVWAFLQAFPDMVEAVLGEKYLMRVDGPWDWRTYRYGSGVFLYSWIDNHAARNTGLFTEPGKYQVVLNSALFILLFWREKLSISGQRNYAAAVLVIIVSIVTCQSTTGYIGLVLILSSYLCVSPRAAQMRNARLAILGLTALLVIGLLIDYSVNTSSSVLHQQIVSKLFPAGLSLDLSSDTGSYRVGMIVVSVRSLLTHPFGVGYDQLFELSRVQGEGLVAASLVSFGAVYGLVPWLLVLFLLFYPPLKWLPPAQAILFILLFINTTLAQTHLLYTSLLLVPAYLAIGHRWPVTRADSFPIPGR